MLSTEILKQPTSVEWAMIDPFGEGRKKHEAEIKDIEPRRVKFGYRVNGLHYATKTRNGRSYSEDENDFYQTSERTYGFLIRMQNGNGGKPYYTVVKPTRFISVRSEYDTFWEAEKLRRAEAERIQQEQYEISQRRRELRDKIRNERHAQAQPEADRTKESLLETIQIVLGQRAISGTSVSISFDGTWEDEESDNPKYSLKQKGTVTLQVADFQRLLEKAMQE